MSVVLTLSVKKQISIFPQNGEHPYVLDTDLWIHFQNFSTKCVQRFTVCLSAGEQCSVAREQLTGGLVCPGTQLPVEAVTLCSSNVYKMRKMSTKRYCHVGMTVVAQVGLVKRTYILSYLLSVTRFIISTKYVHFLGTSKHFPHTQVNLSFSPLVPYEQKCHLFEGLVCDTNALAGWLIHTEIKIAFPLYVKIHFRNGRAMCNPQWLRYTPMHTSAAKGIDNSLSFPKAPWEWAENVMQN